MSTETTVFDRRRRPGIGASIVALGCAAALIAPSSAAARYGGDNGNDDNNNNGGQYDDDNHGGNGGNGNGGNGGNSHDDDNCYRNCGNNDDEYGNSGQQVLARSGECSGGNARWTLVLRKENRRISLRFSVDQYRNSSRWRVMVRHNDNQVLSTQRRGSFTVSQSVRNRRGEDRFLAKAESRYGQTCTAYASI